MSAREHVGFPNQGNPLDARSTEPVSVATLGGSLTIVVKSCQAYAVLSYLLPVAVTKTL